MIKPSLSHSRGSALIIVLWCLLLLGMAVFGVIDMTELSVDHTSNAENRMQALALATTGVSLGLEPQVQKDDPILEQNPTPGNQFKVLIQSEGARLNLNFILQNNHREILVSLFNHWGLNLSDANRVADCLYDWSTPGDQRSLEGAKAIDYVKAGLKQIPTYRQFESLDEVNLVMGMDLVNKAKPDWRDSFTLWSDGPLNISEAPAELIAAVFSIDPDRVQMFTKVRNGRDEIPGTSDDVPVTDLKSFQAALGVTDATFKHESSQIATSGTTRRIESTGQVNRIRATISAVTRLNTSPVQFLLWSEH